MLLPFALVHSFFRVWLAGKGNYKYDELVAEADLLISIGALSDLPLCCTSGMLAMKQQHGLLCMFTTAPGFAEAGPQNREIEGGRSILLLHAPQCRSDGVGCIHPGAGRASFHHLKKGLSFAAWVRYEDLHGG